MISGLDDIVLIPGPSFHVDLSRLDACHPVHYSRRLLIFRCTSHAQRHAQLVAFKTGLQKLLLRCPLLGGLVVPLLDDIRSEEDDWRTIIPGQGIELVVRDLQLTLPSFAELEVANFPVQELPYDLLVPVPQSIANDRPFAACKMQFSSINGGTIIAFSHSHSVADGAGTNELLRILSEETRLAQETIASSTTNNESPESLPTTEVGLDRSVLRNMKSDLPFNIKAHPGFKQPALWLTVKSFQSLGPEVPTLFCISSANLAQLKTDATLRNIKPVISTHDALCALIWRSVLLIRSRRSPTWQNPPDAIRTTLFMPSDGRRHAGLPPGYVGNAVYQLGAYLDLGVLLSPSGLQHAARAVRSAITAVTPSLVASYVAKMRETWIDWAFPETMGTTGVAMGTDWTSGELYSQDWGRNFGPLERFRYPNEAFCCVLPRLPDGSAEVLVSVMADEVDILQGNECFGKYI
jgi:hypothetical protein